MIFDLIAFSQLYRMIVRRVSYFTFIVAITTLASVSACSQAKAMALHAVNGSEPAFEQPNGVPVCSGELVKALQDKGFSLGTYRITKGISDNKEAVKIYLVINKGYKGQVSAKIFKTENEEPCQTCKLFNKIQPAQYLAAGFTPDKRTDIARKNMILLE